MKAMTKGTVCAIALLLTLAPTTALSGSPSAKFAAQVSNLMIIPETSYATWTPVLGTGMKVPEKKELLIGVSFETGLYTRTQVKGKGGERDKAEATAIIKVRVLVDGVPAWPPEVVYDRRAQTLEAVFGGVSHCEDLNGDGMIDVGSECILTDEEITFITDTMAAHHFNFVAANVTTGFHQLTVEVMITSSGSTPPAEAMATVGRGSLSVEEVRATNTEYGIDLQ